MVVNAYSASWLRRGFPWVYPAEVTAGAFTPGDTVRIESDDGTCLGRGVADQGWIAVRRFTERDEEVEAAVARLASTAAARRAVDLGSDARRLVNAENDDLPGLRVDAYRDHLVVTLDSPSLDALVTPLVAGLGVAPASVFVAYRRDPRDAAPVPATRLALGDDPGEVRVQERGVALLVRPSLGKDAGVFTDLRALRAFLEPHWGGRRVLNLFAHTGAFSVAAARWGAARVDSVDLSPGYLDRARRNFQANDLATGGHGFLVEDSFKALDRARRTGQRFDLVVVDPPGYSRSREGSWQGEKDWPRLAAGCIRVVEPGGWLVACSNLGTQSPRMFWGALSAGAERAERRLRLLHEASPPPDHPAALHFPESRYLKAWVLEVS